MTVAAAQRTVTVKFTIKCPCGFVGETRSPNCPACAERKLKEMLAKADQYIEAHALENPSFKTIAKAVGLSPFYFHRLFRAVRGYCPKDRIDELRIAESKRRMLSGQDLAEIAKQLGFSSRSHFGNRFKQIVGDAPSRWLREVLRAGKEQRT